MTADDENDEEGEEVQDEGSSPASSEMRLLDIEVRGMHCFVMVVAGLK